MRSLLKPAEVTKTVLERDSAALEEEGTVVLQNVYQLQSQVFRKLDGNKVFNRYLVLRNRIPIFYLNVY